MMTNALVILIGIISKLYILVLLLRFLLQKLRANWYNPITQITVRLTDFLVKPTRRIIPGFRGYDFAIIVVALFIQMATLWLLLWLGASRHPNLLGLLLIAFIYLLMQLTDIYFYATIIGAIISWFAALQHNPISDIVLLITTPILQRLRRFIPLLAGIDFSPLVLILIIYIIQIALLNPLITSLSVNL